MPCTQVWFKLLFYGLAFEPFGPFVHMVFQIAYAVRAFSVLLFMSCCSFGVALMVLSHYVPAAAQFDQFDQGGAPGRRQRRLH